ncbi:glutathione S-transferase [Crenobacter sp. SG2303]|uniref:Glutathione S-transferase n=1 Tax=Crenobacter oryzisoli TaxID=3056844 RepID=A0ABT7XNB2_9NEIS|nr:glutathione S-transferase [Crenobacter sp. SG2303]MDN0075282.1 glutathione S-transferase [Crenobacter sp. SG2303]
MRYELYYWPTIQGRGEFVRLAFEATGTDYVDVARLPEEDGGGEAAILRLLDGAGAARPPFAPPFLRVGEQLIGQTANILLFLGPRLGLAPRGEPERLWLHQLQLTIADLVGEIHDTHHPIASSRYYEEQKREAKSRAADFLALRLPKFLDYFEGVIDANPRGAGCLVGARLSYADLSMFQVIAGLRYAFPRTMARREPTWPNLLSLYDRVGALPGLAAYLASPRRLPFSEEDVFRHYPELEA